tara:strand:+ start:1026 stop:1244 length:219 start_codon:yes stop_codon:yes gene_type:complete
MNTNDELKNSLIISRRELHANEFVFERDCLFQNVEQMFGYIEANSELKIVKIPRHELPLNMGYFGYRVEGKE